MKVLFAITMGETGGAQEHLRVLAEGLVARGHSVAAVLTVPSDLASRLPEHGVEVMPWPSIVRDPDPRNDLRARRELQSAVRAFNPDVLHLYSAKAGVLGRGIARRPDTVTVYTCHHAPYGPGRRWSHRLVGRPIEQLTLRYVDGIISDGARDLPMIRKVAPSVPTRLIPNAVPTSFSPESPEDPVPGVLWVARMKHPKDPMLAIRSWELAAARHSDARFTLCGTGPLENKLRRRIEASPARPSISYPGRVPDLRDYYRASSIFLLTSAVEGGVTMATLEAMAHGLVPVLSDVGDAFLIDHAEAGIVVPRNSVRATGEALDMLLSSPEQVRAMRERALRFARERWTVEQFVSATERFYTGLTAGS